MQGTVANQSFDSAVWEHLCAGTGKIFNAWLSCILRDGGSSGAVLVTHRKPAAEQSVISASKSTRGINH